MIKVLIIFGTRPEAVKLAPVIKAFKNNEEAFQTVVLATAQHRSMLDQVLDLFRIVPDYDLNLMTENQNLIDVTSKCLYGVDEILKKENPDIVLIQGDTTTVFASSLACYYNKIPVGHVEAGLRTADKYSPFPEEMNRRVASVLADLHFAPTDWAKGNLLKEGVPDDKIHVTGNTVVDALMEIVSKPMDFEKNSPQIDSFMRSVERIILVTAHRRESFGQPFEELCMAMRKIVEINPEVGIIYPVHPNPNVRETVYGMLENHPRILLLEPLDYLTFVHLMKHSHIILTDSGGIQEEAPSLKKPVLIMREKTERPEAVDSGAARLVGTDSGRIIGEVQRLLDYDDEYRKMTTGINPFGDGRASERIVKIIKDFANGS